MCYKEIIFDVFCGGVRRGSHKKYYHIKCAEDINLL